MTLAAYLRAEGLTYEKFAPKVRAATRTVGKWVRGERIPRPAAQARIKTATGGLVEPNDWIFPAASTGAQTGAAMRSG